MRSLLSRPLRAAWLAMALSLLAACAAPAPEAGPDPLAAATPAGQHDALRPAPPMSRPLPPLRRQDPAAPAAAAPVALDYRCASDADCAVKDVGSCCGYRPACLNKDSPTDPEAVRAQCARDGRAGVCGFPSVSQCQCVQGRCEADDDARLLP